MRKRVITNYTNDKYEKDSCLMKDIIKDDEEQFNNQLTEYYNEMNNIKEYISNETQEEIKKRKQKIYINLDTLKMLKIVNQKQFLLITLKIMMKIKLN